MKKELYKIDNKGQTRVWWIEYDHEKYRTHSGILGGKIVESGWIYPTEKNVGKANHTTVREQVILEVEAEYTKKQNQGKYHTTLEEAEGGAKFVVAMLAQKYNPSKDTKFPYISQPKLDGHRCLVSKYHMQTRNGKEYVSCPHIQAELKKFFEINPDVVLDGELYNHNLKDDFEKISSLVRKTKPTEKDLQETARLVEYHVYDAIVPSAKTFTDRYRTFVTDLAGLERIKVVRAEFVHDADELNQKMSEYLEAGYEGQMLRVDETPYEHKRSKSLLKNKEFEDAEFKVIDIIEGVGNWAGMAKSVEIQLPDGSTQFSGMSGSYDFAAEILTNKESLIGTDVTVRYQGTTSDNKLRFPVVKHFWRGTRDL